MFEYGVTQYIQQDVKAIGSKLGKYYLCTYLFERAKVKLYMYKRFVDDIFGIWGGTLEELYEFHRLANSIHNNIKVDLRTSTVSIKMLDTRLYVVSYSLYKHVKKVALLPYFYFILFFSKMCSGYILCVENYIPNKKMCKYSYITCLNQNL